MIVTEVFAFQGENPIYKSAVTTVVNPKYEGKWWHHCVPVTSAIKYPTTAVFAVGLGSEGKLWWNLCNFFLSLYHYVLCSYCIRIFTNTYDLNAFVVF